MIRVSASCWFSLAAVSQFPASLLYSACSEEWRSSLEEQLIYRHNSYQSFTERGYYVLLLFLLLYDVLPEQRCLGFQKKYLNSRPEVHFFKLFPNLPQQGFEIFRICFLIIPTFFERFRSSRCTAGWSIVPVLSTEMIYFEVKREVEKDLLVAYKNSCNYQAWSLSNEYVCIRLSPHCMQLQMSSDLLVLILW